MYRFCGPSRAFWDWSRVGSFPAGTVAPCYRRCVGGKSCRKLCDNAHAKNQFCNTKCRNYYNVKVFRKNELFIWINY